MTENKSLSYKDINNSGNIINSKEHFNLKYIEELKNKKLVFKKINNNQRLYVKTNSNFAIAFELDDKNICHILLVDEKNGSENDLTGEFNIEKER